MPAPRAVLGQPILSLGDPDNERRARPVGVELDGIGRRSPPESWRRERQVTEIDGTRHGNPPRVRRGGEILGDAGTEGRRHAPGYGDSAWELTREFNGESVGSVDFGPMPAPNVGGVRAMSGGPEWKSTRQFNGGCAGPMRPLADTDTESWGRARQGHAKGTEILNGIRPGNSMAGGPGRCALWPIPTLKVGGVRAKGTEILNGIRPGNSMAGASGRRDPGPMTAPKIVGARAGPQSP